MLGFGNAEVIRIRPVDRASKGTATLTAVENPPVATHLGRTCLEGAPGFSLFSKMKKSGLAGNHKFERTLRFQLASIPENCHFGKTVFGKTRRCSEPHIRKYGEWPQAPELALRRASNIVEPFLLL